MDVPGRRSAASLAVAPVQAWTRLEPPPWLIGDAAELWTKVVSTKPSDWFTADTAPLLEAYCNTVIEYRRAAVELQASSPADLRSYKALVDITTSLASRMAGIATKLRLTPQSRYTPQSAATASKKAATIAKPWG